MPKLTHSVPRLCKRSVNGTAYAVVYLNDKQIQCGRWNTRAAKAEYDRLIGEWLNAGRPSRIASTSEDVSVAQLCAAFWKHAKGYYHNSNVTHYKIVIRALRKRYGHTFVSVFGPRALKTLRQSFVASGACRKYANQKTQCIRQILRWGLAEDLVPPDVVQKLSAVAGLRRGKCDARETEPVEAVPIEDVEATLPNLPQTVADLLRVQLLTGARPGEICSMRPMDVKTDVQPWEYRPESHKTQHHGKQRVIFIGPKAQDVLRPYLLRSADQYCFRPADSEKKRRRAAHDVRKTPLSCGNKPGTNRKRKPQHQPGEMYIKDALNRAVSRGVDKLNAKRREESLPLVARWTKPATPYRRNTHSPRVWVGSRAGDSRSFESGCHANLRRARPRQG